ncbi:GreA/GreB family elongation factor [Adhaeribacter rhizoryzae]|uniref:GreA/GreB family elongation factor n=1 Tax=Adhaeribacter rhizoryzae TaxID=2607907 RepID=A0A5M6DB17_9BACT|nr:GreA/GreB family elongation factor [Adhaeribacter rhizoryzae]KAA5543502.1 GreA/GreB family elongation factor [Adhaeribacter rhizoryzae]
MTPETTTKPATNLLLKQQLLAECLRIQNSVIQTAKSAMDEAQQSANEHQGALEDKFESFREACQIQRDMFAKQLDEAIISLSVLKRIVATKENKHIMLGSIVITSLQKYFISISLGEITVNGEKYFAISAMSPLFKAMVGKSEGEEFTFRDNTYRIESIF